jgi:hypothetical protein
MCIFLEKGSGQAYIWKLFPETRYYEAENKMQYASSKGAVILCEEDGRDIVKQCSSPARKLMF